MDHDRMIPLALYLGFYVPAAERVLAQPYTVFLILNIALVVGVYFAGAEPKRRQPP
jgi:hypothetical protein